MNVLTEGTLRKERAEVPVKCVRCSVPHCAIVYPSVDVVNAMSTTPVLLHELFVSSKYWHVNDCGSVADRSCTELTTGSGASVSERVPLVLGLNSPTDRPVDDRGPSPRYPYGSTVHDSVMTSTAATPTRPSAPAGMDAPTPFPVTDDGTLPTSLRLSARATDDPCSHSRRTLTALCRGGGGEHARGGDGGGGHEPKIATGARR